jgi:hypothetical protein
VYLAADPQLRCEMSRRNRAKAEANLPWSNATQKYLTMYEGMLSSAPRQGLVAPTTVSV